MVSIKEYVELRKKELKSIVDSSNKDYRLDIFQVVGDDASKVYVNGKVKDCKDVGILPVVHLYDVDRLSEYYIDVASKITQDMRTIEFATDGVLLQLPVPEEIDALQTLRNGIKFRHTLDVDGFLYDIHTPCTARGIVDWLLYNNVNLENKNVVIIGRSNIVGRPLAKLMLKHNANVTVCHSHTSREKLGIFCQNADIIVSAVGKPKEFCFRLDNDQIVIDVGINRDENGKLCGDFDREVMLDCGSSNLYITPVPGGVGLLTRVALLSNVLNI